MRTSSGKRSIGKYRPESVRPDTGYGYGSGSGRGSVDVEPFEERRAREFEFVRKTLPGEIPGLCVSALLSLRALGEKPTRDSIYARLENQGRTVRQLRERGWLE